MKNLMLLHNRHTPDDSDIWRVAVRRGWATKRTSEPYVRSDMEGYDFIRYYGNTLHGAMIEPHLPFRFSPINPKHLANLRGYTKRWIKLVKFSDIIQPIVADMFIKPARDKWFEAKVWLKGETITGAPQADDLCYVSDIVPFLDEVRCFVLDGQVQTSSLYRINTVSYQEVDEPEASNFDERMTDTPICGYARAIATTTDLPSGVVMDFGRTSDGQWSLIEFNEAWASGLYFCHPEKCFDVICASQK